MWHSGESARLPLMWPGFKSRHRRYMWVEFVVGSLPCSERFFYGYSGFLLSSKTNISKFQFDQESGRRRTTMWMCYLQIVIYLFTYLVYSPHQYRHFPWPPQRFLLSVRPLNGTHKESTKPIHANSPGLSGNLPDTTPICWSPGRVTKSPK